MSATGKISLEQLAKDITACKKAIEAAMPAIEEAELFINEMNEPDEPQKIQGYTAEQWQEIIDGGYLCEFAMTASFFEPYLQTLDAVTDKQFCSDKEGGIFALTCRPAQLKGVMRPIFVEPSSVGAYCVFFDEYGHVSGYGNWESYWTNKDNTKYIDL